MSETTVGDVVQDTLRSDERVKKLRWELMADHLTADQVAEILGLERSTILRYLRGHELVGYQLGRRWMIPEVELRAFMQRQLEQEREAARVAAGEAEAIRKCKLWSATRPYKRWAVHRCAECGHDSFLCWDDADEQYEDIEGFYVGLKVVRRGRCEVCGTEANVASAEELNQKWAEWRGEVPDGNGSGDRNAGVNPEIDNVPF
jgi:excisionase family DNA binding protein